MVDLIHNFTATDLEIDEDRETVDFQPNYDESVKEPQVLPAEREQEALVRRLRRKESPGGWYDLPLSPVPPLRLTTRRVEQSRPAR